MNGRMYRELVDRIREEEMKERNLQYRTKKPGIKKGPEEEPELTDIIVDEMRLRLMEAAEALEKLGRLIHMLELDRFLEKDICDEECCDSMDEADGIAYIFE